MAQDVKRMSYFDGLYLKEEEFLLEQAYHNRMRRQHNARMHTPGVVWGLNLSVVAGFDSVAVSPGLALDKVFDDDVGDLQSRELYIPNEVVINLSIYPANAVVWVWMVYNEEEVDVVENGGDRPIHVLESAEVRHGTAKPIDEDENVILAKVTIEPDGSILPSSIATEESGVSLRKQSGFAGASVTVDNLTLTDPSIAEEFPKLEGHLFPVVPGETISYRGMKVRSERSEFSGRVDVLGDFAGRVPLGGVVAVFNYGANTPVGADEITGDGFMLANGGALPPTSKLHAMALANSVPQVRPNLTNNVFLMGATASGQTGGANQVTVTIPAHRHEEYTLEVTGQGTFSVTGSTGFIETDLGLLGHSHYETFFDFISNGGLALVPFGADQPEQTKATSGPIQNVNHTHSLTGGSITLNTLAIGGMVGNEAGQLGDTTMNATPHENRPNFVSTIFLIRVN